MCTDTGQTAVEGLVKTTRNTESREAVEGIDVAFFFQVRKRLSPQNDANHDQRRDDNLRS